MLHYTCMLCLYNIPQHNMPHVLIVLLLVFLCCTRIICGSELKADHSPPTSAEVKKTLICTATPPYAFMAYCLISYTQRQLYLLHADSLSDLLEN
jgi:hypothetical protein